MRRVPRALIAEIYRIKLRNFVDALPLIPAEVVNLMVLMLIELFIILQELLTNSISVVEKMLI